ncbi:O-methyltransferase [Sediminibacterium goheungense]|uniref:Methyltransferase family protein n=1 Tax=Sediminibacterium goheungense TaxID=1086393 RepID=A0A4R6J2M8_9BACT|nr:class I SAM-dependent methyltransferase [Sediminibacterium goheungense]TDO28526.1 methyltransferase family protein [Sediminibacterium goheungense]
MYSTFQLAAKYLRFYVGASNSKGHGVHSPFVFDFIQYVLNDDRVFYAYRQIENLRQLLKADQRVLEIKVGGDTSGASTSGFRKIADIASSSVGSAKYGQLLFRITDKYGPSEILEIGTSLGITTGYLAMANPNTSVTTIEEAGSLAKIASANFQKLGIRNVRLLEGDINQQLSGWLAQGRNIDLALVNGLQVGKSVIRYYRSIRNNIHEKSILVFDGIHTGTDMEEVWKEIQQDQAVTLSIDLFGMGLVFFRKEFRVQQHISIRF